MGVKKGYKHYWKYTGKWSEKKTGPGRWNFTFKATKGKKSKSYGSFKKGFKIKWRIKGTQTATKTKKGTYQTVFKGRKRLINYKVPYNRYR